MKITKTRFPEKSLLFADHEKYDYIDSFGGVFSDMENKVGIEDIAADFLKPLPRWVDALMNLRDMIVSLVGLKTSSKSKWENQPKNFQFIPGEQIGFFNVYDRTDNELVLGEDDKHLNFRISLFLENQANDPSKKLVAITTVVTFNNWLGSFYFFFVKPFHKRIVPAMMKKDFDQLSNPE
jgi:hypothetical protein